MNSLVPHRSALPASTVSMPAVQAEPDTLDLSTVLEAARRRWLLFLVVFGLVLGAAFVLTLVQKPKFTASSAVMMDPRQIQIFQSREAANVSGDLSVATEAVATQVQVFTSRGMAERVVDALHLEQDPAYADPPLGLIGKVKAKAGAPLGMWQPKTLTPQERRQTVVDTVLGRLDAQRLGLTYVIGVKYTDPSAERAAAIANAYADSYIQQSIQGKSDATKQAGGYLNARLKELSDQAAADAAAVEQYRVGHNLLGSTGATLTEQEISGLNGQIAGSRAEAAADQAKVDTARAQLKKGSSGDDVGAALGSPVIQSLRSQRAQVSGQLAELNSRYGPRYPDVIKAQEQLADIDSGIRTEINRVISNLQANAQVSAKRLASLEGTLGQSRGTLASNTKSQAGLIQLQQKAASSQSIYDSYLSRFKEIMTSAGTEQSDARIVSQAEPPPTPSSPKVLLDLALGFIIASMLAMIAAIIAETVDRSFASGQEIERRLNAPFVGSIPLLSSVARKVRKTPTDYVAANPFSVFAEGFRNLKLSVLQARAGGGPTIVAVTSPLTAEGKTTTSVCLGQTSAMQGAKTIVVDCDLRRRSLQRFLPAPPEVGLIEVIRGAVKLEEAVVADEKTGLHFLPLASTSKLTADDVFGSQEMDELLTKLRSRYDFVILDTAPLLALADARILAAKADAVVLLCRWRKTPQDALRSALRLLHTADAPVAGVALTRVDVRKQTAHGYGDSSYYYRETQAYHTA